MKAARSLIASNGLPFRQMRSIGHCKVRKGSPRVKNKFKIPELYYLKENCLYLIKFLMRSLRRNSSDQKMGYLSAI